MDERGEREGKEEVEKTGTQMFAAGSEENGSKRTHRHQHARTATPRLVGESPEPRWSLDRPLVGGAPVGERQAVTHHLIWR